MPPAMRILSIASAKGRFILATATRRLVEELIEAARIESTKPAQHEPGNMRTAWQRGPVRSNSSQGSLRRLLEASLEAAIARAARLLKTSIQ